MTRDERIEDHRKKRQARELATCVHFTGIQHPTCKAGVRYTDVRDSRPNGPFRWPCTPTLDGTTCPTTCAKRQLPTIAEVEAEEERFKKSAGDTMTARAAIVAVLGPFVKGKGWQGVIDCPVCKTGKLSYQRSGYNGHIMAGCTTAGCVRWME